MPEPTPSQTLEAVIERYMKLREMKKEIQNSVKPQLEAVNERMRTIEIALLDHMNKNGLTSLSTSIGTAYQSPKYTVSIPDWDAALSFVREREAWHLLTKKLSDVAVREYLEEGVAVPGVDLKTWVDVNIRRK